MATKQLIKVLRVPVCEYVREGETYEVTRNESGRGGCADAYFWNAAQRCGTPIREHVVVDAIKSGAFQVVG